MLLVLLCLSELEQSHVLAVDWLSTPFNLRMSAACWHGRRELLFDLRSRKFNNLVLARHSGRVVSASVSGSGGPGSDPGGVT